jgi:hypothetical protein
MKGMKEALRRHPLPWKTAQTKPHSIEDANRRTVFVAGPLDPSGPVLAAAIVAMVNDLLQTPEESERE